jgi:hypothetical protein
VRSVLNADWLEIMMMSPRGRSRMLANTAWLA